ncbi:MAG: DUF6183 family protein [Actinomycetota bacterium]
MSADLPDDDADLDGLVHSADLDGLVRMIDDRTSSRDWDGLLRLRNRSRAAVETGRQLWPAATLAEYRLALLAPAPFVAAVLDESDGASGRFTIGPLTEVAAHHHDWAELAPHLDRGPRATFVAHERSIRGEAINAADAAELPPVLDLPVELRKWEPTYLTATYTDAGAEFPAPDFLDSTDELRPVDVTHGGSEATHDSDVGDAIEQLVEPWTNASNGQVDVVEVADGRAADAIGALGAPAARLQPLPTVDALQWLGWAGASGGAHGRRRGAAAGRFGVWWVLAALGDLADEFPPADDEIRDLLDDLRWFRWDAGEPNTGWTLQLAIEDTRDSVAWAIVARDAV